MTIVPAEPKVSAADGKFMTMPLVKVSAENEPTNGQISGSKM